MNQKIDINRSLDDSGKITQPSSMNKTRIAVLNYLASKFEDGRDYTEIEINDICGQWYTFDDYFIIRRL